MTPRVRYGVFVVFLLVGAVPTLQAVAEVLATVDGQTLTEDDLPDLARGQIVDLEAKLYEGKLAAVEAAVGQRLVELEARRLGTTPATLLATKVAPAAPVTAEDVRRFYEDNRARIRDSFEEVRERIEEHLREGRKREAHDRYVAELRRQHRVEVRLVPPRVAVTTEGPSRGPQNAPVVLVEFSDYQCPFCREIQKTLARLRQEYGDGLRHVFRDFPIDRVHPDARGGHIAARCAGQQGKYWEYHDRLFGEPEKMKPRDLTAHAHALGLEEEAFQRCVSGDEASAAVGRDLAEGLRAGVDITPTFFVNGRRLTGTQPYEAFKTIIEEERARSRR